MIDGLESNVVRLAGYRSALVAFVGDQGTTWLRSYSLSGSSSRLGTDSDLRILPRHCGSIHGRDGRAAPSNSSRTPLLEPHGTPYVSRVRDLCDSQLCCPTRPGHPPFDDGGLSRRPGPNSPFTFLDPGRARLHLLGDRDAVRCARLCGVCIEKVGCRRFFLANALVTPMIALVYFYPRFSIPLLFLGTPWLVTGPGSFLLLALMFRREAFQVSASRA